MNRPEDYINTITTIEFKIFDQSQQTFVYDANIEQSCNFLWKKFSTASIKKMTIFNLKTGDVVHVDSVEYNSIKNKYLIGTNDNGTHSKKIAELQEKYK
jgi:hypothetical protein